MFCTSVIEKQVSRLIVNGMFFHRDGNTWQQKFDDWPEKLPDAFNFIFTLYPSKALIPRLIV